MDRVVSNFYKQWKESGKLEKKLAEAVTGAMARYPEVHVTRIHDSVLLEGKPEECKAFLQAVKEWTSE